MDQVLAKLIPEDLTDKDIRLLCPDTPVYLLNELARVRSLPDLFKNNSCVIILFPIKSILVGHWICIINQGSYFEHFDPYGFDPIKEYSYSEVNITNYLEVLYTRYAAQGGKVVFNTVRYQEMKDGVNTCGRHTCTRVKLHYLQEPRYRSIMIGQKYNPDQLVVMMTMLQINT